MVSVSDPSSSDNGGTSGEELRDAALSLLSAARPALVRELQAAILRVALERGEVVADDVRALVPIPPPASPKVVGAAFRQLADAGVLRITGYRKSQRPQAHARTLTVWVIADPAKALARLSIYATN